jgi:alkane 1-monooxygenase
MRTPKPLPLQRGPLEPSPRWAVPYLLSLVLPLMATAFFLVPIHRRWVALAWIVTLAAIAVTDELLPPVTGRRAPEGASFARVADGVVALQIVNFVLFAWRVSVWGISVDTGLAVLLLGVGGAFSSMIAAHELIHRPTRASRLLGRALLWTVVYDQFFIDHLRGHHRTVGTANDVLTARSDETFLGYLARSWPGELRSAWRIELRRSAGRGPFAALFRNDFLRGALAEAALLSIIAVLASPSVAAFVVIQAALAHLLVVAVNFIEHWGIVRVDRKVRAGDAWDSAAPLSHYALLGLSFHADHHVRASRAFDRLELHDESPRMPYGYFAMIGMVLFQNQRVRRLLGAELADRERRSEGGSREAAPTALQR